MAVIKRSVSIDAHVAAEIEAAAEEDSTTFSAWLNEAAQHRLRLRAGLAAVAAYEAEAGEISDQELAAARRHRERLQHRNPQTRRGA